jgi:hypothetical protein
METEFNDLGVRGNSHDDTVEFDDVELLEGCQNVRLVRIRVWYDDYIYGLQTIYESSNNGMIVSPKRMNDDVESWKLQYEEIFFNRNENITKLYGKNGAIIDSVTFETNQGRELRFGGSGGGDDFDIEIPEGNAVGALKGGYGGHLHNIGCSIIPTATPLQYQYTYNSGQRVENQISAGPTHDDTEDHNDVEFLEGTKGQHRITSIVVYFSEDFVHGLIINYEEAGREIKTRGIGGDWDREEHKYKKLIFSSDEWIKNISGSIGNVCDLLIFETTKGRVEKFGNEEKEETFNFEIPEGNVISGLSFGTGGHIHNLTAYYGPEPIIFRFEQPPAVNTQYSLLSNSSSIRGNVHDETKPFDDWEKVSADNINTRIKKVTVYYDEDKTVYGFRLKWNVNEEEVEGDKHRGSKYDGWVKNGDKKSFSLKYGEYITRVYGRNGACIDRLCFELNTGDIHEFGGDGGDSEFDCEIPEGHALGALTGGFGETLHNVQAWYGKINSTAQSQGAVYIMPNDNRFPHECDINGLHPESVEFKDEGVDFNAMNYRIDTVKIYYTNLVVGIQVIYEVDGQYIYGEKHMASGVSEEEVKVEMLNMEIDEFITHVSARTGALIDHITIRTNKDREISAGGDGGENMVEADIPEGYCVGVIEGAANGHMHMFKLHCGPVPEIMTTHW